MEDHIFAVKFGSHVPTKPTGGEESGADSQPETEPDGPLVDRETHLKTNQAHLRSRVPRRSILQLESGASIVQIKSLIGEKVHDLYACGLRYNCMKPWFYRGDGHLRDSTLENFVETCESDRRESHEANERLWQGCSPSLTCF
jgi:hypothetical protein